MRDGGRRRRERSGQRTGGPAARTRIRATASRVSRGATSLADHSHLADRSRLAERSRLPERSPSGLPGQPAPNGNRGTVNRLEGLRVSVRGGQRPQETCRGGGATNPALLRAARSNGEASRRVGQVGLVGGVGRVGLVGRVDPVGRVDLARGRGAPSLPAATADPPAPLSASPSAPLRAGRGRTVRTTTATASAGTTSPIGNSCRAVAAEQRRRMSRLLTFIFSTSGAVIGLLVEAVAVWRRPASRAARRFLIAVALFYTVAATYAVPAAIGSLLSRGYHPFQPGDAPGGVTAIVLLGSGAERVFRWNAKPWAILDAVGAARVAEAARLYRTINPACLIISGGGLDPFRERGATSLMMRDALVALGVPAEIIELESRSRNTHDESVLIAPMLRELRIEHVVLVTSDVHMRRSIAAFRAQGWNAIPAIAPDPRLALPAVRRWYPTDYGLALSAEVVHELAGMPYYRLRGWA